MSRRAELVSAFSLLTRIPFGGLAGIGAAADPARSVWAFPIVGAVLGTIGALIYWLGHALGLPAFAAGIFAVGGVVLATGGLHEDGAADTADGLGGGANRARKLEIMRDSRIGTYGVIALVLVFALRLSVIGVLADVSVVATALIATAMLSRAAIVPLMHMLPRARTDGLAAHVGPVGRNAALEATAIAALGAFLLLPFGTAVVAIVAAAIGAGTIGLLARAHLGGQTGDILGAACVAAECGALAAILAVIAPG